MNGQSIAVLPWPAHEALVEQKNTSTVFIISIRTIESNDRRLARRQIRAALEEAIGVLMGSDSVQFNLIAIPGQPPCLSQSSIGLSLSHESGLSVAAIHLRGAVGIDIVRRDIVAAAEGDWHRLAHDYLGQAASERIEQSSPEQRLDCFSREWTAREARLKCSGSTLVEWRYKPDPLTHGTALRIDLPQPYVGTVVVDQ